METEFMGGMQRGAGLLATAAILLFVSLPAECAPPFVTDDPEPVEYGHAEVNIASQRVSNQEGTVVTPLLDVGYGVHPDMQLNITVPYVFNNSGGMELQGWGDVDLGLKYRFLQETETQPMMAFYPVLVVPTGNASKGLGNGKAQLFLPVWLQKRWGSWQSSGGLGYWINQVSGVGNNWYFGWLLQKDINDYFTLGGEAFHATDQLPADNSSTGYTIGAIVRFDESHRLLFSAGRGLTDIAAQNTFSSYLGYGFTW